MERNDNEQFGSFALNALNDEERDEVLRQLQASSAARRDIDSMHDTAARLGLGTTPVEPPAGLKANIMDAIRQTPQLPPLPDEDAAADPEPATEQARPADRPAAGPAGGKVPGRGRQKFFALAAGVLLVAAGGLGAAAWNLNTQQHELAGRLDAMAKEHAEMAQILSAPDMLSKSQTLKDGATITLSYSATEGLMAVSTAGMPQLPQEKGYELWLISADGAIPAGMLDASDANGLRMIAGSMEGVTHFGITVEPAAGSAAPTTEPIMLQGL